MGVGVNVKVGVGVDVGVGVTVGVAVDVGVRVAVGVGVEVGRRAVGVNVGTGVGVGRLVQYARTPPARAISKANAANAHMARIQTGRDLGGAATVGGSTSSAPHNVQR